MSGGALNEVDFLHEACERSRGPTEAIYRSLDSYLESLSETYPNGTASETRAVLFRSRPLALSLCRSLPSGLSTSAHCVRSLFEALVDLLLLRERGEDAVQRIRSWEFSARLHFADQVAEFYSRRKEEVPPQERAILDFRREHGEEVRKSRRAQFDTTKHPNRWTQSSLEADARRLHQAGTLDALDLEWFYQCVVRRLHWFVHGSANTAFLGMELQQLLSFDQLAQHWGSELLRQLVREAAEELGDDPAPLEEPYDEAKASLGLWIILNRPLS